MIVKQLITDAIYKSLQDRELDPVVNSGYLLWGLEELNNILDEWRDKIPYNSVTTFNDVQSLENSRFTEITTVNYVLNNTSYSLKSVNLTKFKEIQQVIGLTGFPSCYYFDELTLGIQVYPAPSNSDYQFTVWGKAQQLSLGLTDEIPFNMPRFMINAATYELAFRFAAEYGALWDAKKETIRNSLLNSLMTKQVVDLNPDLNCVFGNSGSTAPFPYFYYISGGGQ